MSWISVILINSNGEKEFHQFGNEEELRYFLSVHEEEGYKVDKVVYHEE